jgi:hypothetical protein
MFEQTLAKLQQRYRERRRAYDELFVHRPFDAAGSGSYRWLKMLERLDACDPSALATRLAEAIAAK